MKRTWMAALAIAGGSALFAQQSPNYQYDPRYNGQYGNGQYDNGQYDNGQYAPDPGYDGYTDPGVYAPAPPPAPSYAYQRPPMPGPGYLWVDGYWNFLGGRYVWVGGYWTLRPYAGGYWVSPRYSSGRYFRGFWSGGRANFNRGPVRNDRYQGHVESRRWNDRAPAPHGNGFRGNDNRGTRRR